MRRWGVLLLAAVLVSCDDDATGPEGLCIAVVNVDGVILGPTEAAVAPADVDTEPYVEITRSTGCLDQGEPDAQLEHGESNDLPVGETLHRIEGFEPTERLAWRSAETDEWRVLYSLEILSSAR